jgi:hypothetical protein
MPRTIDQDAPHRDRCSSEKVPPVLPVGLDSLTAGRALRPKQSQVRFVDQHGRLKGRPPTTTAESSAALTRQHRRSQRPKFLVHQWQKRIGCEPLGGHCIGSP